MAQSDGSKGWEKVRKLEPGAGKGAKLCGLVDEAAWPYIAADDAEVPNKFELARAPKKLQNKGARLTYKIDKEKKTENHETTQNRISDESTE